MNGYPKRIYLSSAWNGDFRPPTVDIANLIAAQDATVVRDHQENQKSDPLKDSRTFAQRVDSMMRDCSALVVILFYNCESRQGTTPFVIPEILAADAQGIPILLLVNPGVDIQPTQDKAGFQFGNRIQGPLLKGADVFTIPAKEWEALDELLKSAQGFTLERPNLVKGCHTYPNQNPRATAAAIEDFVRDCPERKQYPYVFNILPFSLKDSVHKTIAAEVFKATGMACHISLDTIDEKVSMRASWRSMLENSELIIAELSSLRDTCLFETGYALGLEKRVFVVSRKGQEKLPFGLDDQTFHQYPSTEKLAAYVRDECCKAYRREVFNLSPDFEKADPNVAGLPGAPGWFGHAGPKFDLQSRLTVSIWAMCISLAFAIQIGVNLISPGSPTPNMLALLSLLSGVLAVTRVGREYWEKKIGRCLSWLPWVGIGCVVLLTVALTALVVAKPQSSSPQAPIIRATNGTSK